MWYSNCRFFTKRHSLRIIYNILSNRRIPYHWIVHCTRRRPVRRDNDNDRKYIRSNSKSNLYSIGIPGIGFGPGRLLGAGFPGSEPERHLWKRWTNYYRNLSVCCPSTAKPSRRQPVLLRDRRSSDWRKPRNHCLSQTVQFDNGSFRRPLQAHWRRDGATHHSNASVRLKSWINNDGPPTPLPRPIQGEVLRLALLRRFPCRSRKKDARYGMGHYRVSQDWPVADTGLLLSPCRCRSRIDQRSDRLHRSQHTGDRID